MSRVVIGIQARSGSTRLPRKAFQLIGGLRLLDHVVGSCKSAATYMERFADRYKTRIHVVILTPTGDPIAHEFKRSCPILEGSNDDVLSRYAGAADHYDADVVVRVTGDCPLIPDYLIVKHIKTAIVNNYDYISNTDEDSRTAIDGHDCEVMSRRMIEWLDETSDSAYEREHVTPRARRDPPVWAKVGAVIHYHDQSGIKLSVDTPDDLERVREAYDLRAVKMVCAQRKFGKSAVHKL